MITLEQAKALKYGDTLHHSINKNADGTPQRWRVIGKPRTWKTRPNEVQVPIKSGLKCFGHLTEDTLNLVEMPT